MITLKFINIKDRVLNIIQGNIIEQELKSLSTIGDRLIYLRKRKKLTRKALAPLIGIEYNVLHKYETNKYKPKIDRIKIFADFYNVPVEYITGEEIDELDINDIYFISNLKLYCWQISQGFASVDNYDELVLSAIKGTRIVANSIYTCCNNINDSSYMMYVYNVFSNNNNPLLDIEENTIAAVEYVLDNLIKGIKSQADHIHINIDFIFKVIDYGTCTLCILNKKEYDQLVSELQPLIESYVESAKKSEE